MRTILLAFGIVAMFLGMLAGCLNWLVVEFLYESLGEDTWTFLNSVTWLLNTLGFGVGGILIGIGALLEKKH